MCAAALGCAALSGAASPAWATEPVVYERAYFDEFAPQNAADMVDRIPGFTIRGQEGGERGFGQASLNILINGRRPSSKSLGANAILERISVERVVRIEVVDGTTLDIPGLSGDVANIVTEAFGLTGNWEYAARFEEGTEPQLLEGEASVAISRGDATVTLSADIGQFTFTEDGIETVFDGDNIRIEDRFEDIVFETQRPQFDAALNWTPANGNVLNLNGNIEFQNENFDLRRSFQAVTPAGSDGQNIFFSGEDEVEWELGGDYEFGFGGEGNRLKLIGLYGSESTDFTNRVADFTLGRAPDFDEFLQDTDSTEIIARAEYTLDGGAWQASAEYAFNELEAASEFNGVVLPFVNVTEDRVQGALSHNRRLGAWDLQASAGVEYSELAVPSNPDSEAREFVRPKGFIAASRDLDAKHSLVLRAERSVGQLDFFDFVSDVDLNEGRDDRGNEEIVPDQTLLLEATVERTDPTGLSWRLNPQYALITDPIDRIRFADGSEGPGNLNSNASFYGVVGNFTWILDDIRNGLRLSGNGTLIETEIEDPLTGDTRRFNGGALWAAALQLRHDIEGTPFAYEIDISDTAKGIRSFRFDQEFRFERDKPELSIAVEHKDFFGMNLRIIGANLLDRQGERQRLFFQGDRFGPLIQFEDRIRARGPRLSFVLSDTF